MGKGIKMKHKRFMGKVGASFLIAVMIFSMFVVQVRGNADANDSSAEELWVRINDAPKQEANDFLRTEKLAIATAPMIEVSGGNGVHIVITNEGMTDLTNINWQISIENCLFIVPHNYSGIIDCLTVGQSYEINRSFFGIGLGLYRPKPTITTSVVSSQGPHAELKKEAGIFGRHVKIL
jgi:hypothetical protein